ncbi:hypothetical protein Mapa_012494 [Marchantia paleacea]|nr:hypothetical protein Mapa_012494 [Marchantia paleacea]
MTTTVRRVLFVISGLTLLGSSRAPNGVELTTDPTVPNRHVLLSCEALCNIEGSFALVMGFDGNLVLYDTSGGRLRRLWSPAVWPSALRYLILANDGELATATYDGIITWRNNYHGPTGLGIFYRAFITNTGDFVVCNNQNQCVWHSGSHFFQIRTDLIGKIIEGPVLDEDDRRVGCLGWTCE